MATFKDSTGQEWRLEFSVPVMKRVKERTGYHLGRLLDNECALLTEITGDIITFVDVLWAMVEGQAATAGVTDQQFGERITGDVFAAAEGSFWEALKDFSPSRTRPLIAALMTKGREVQAALEPRISQALEAIERMTAEEMIQAALISSKSATSPPASSALTQPA